ncbi:MAG: 16S rRNA (cytidine(1402)-2'-O)-methyltransferase [Pseudomonadota bacterium]|nr:16S rRNA (cytidine(1402)-2'-O)-methyltransferase [Pseudomonadota bacterium]
MSGTLYIVATPIGNLGDISERAISVLRDAAVVAVEDTRHSRKLLLQFGIATPMIALHDFNESERVAQILERLRDGDDVALISDAGTPLISDPGYQLVRQAHAQGYAVVPVPGACAVVAALSAAGLPTDRFTFEGFLPAKQAARLATLAELANESRTMVFYEAPHRIVECLADMVQSFGAEREVTLARELTKTFETIVHATLAELLERVQRDANQQKGEIVLVVAGKVAAADEVDAAALHTLQVLLGEMPLKQAAAVAARITGIKKNLLYETALQLKHEKD